MPSVPDDGERHRLHGREDLLKTVAEFACGKLESACPTIVLCGKGGLGKTRLARELSDTEAILEIYKDGIP